MNRWQEHLPMASASLWPTFARAARERAQFSSAERALFTTCDFWAAVRARNLARYVEPSPLDALRYVGILYAAIGADAVARDVIVTVGELERACCAQDREQCLAKLEEQLLTTHDPVDQLIVRLAETLGLDSESSSRSVFVSERVMASAQA